ncbi:DUF4956 domain-containing protein [Actinomyces sp. MRS3W]|uniref:DUF4956 domain-containing protein n=1 Tax=Actinomyces sp. MRS3W TaxID=2800796 RepID=UPI0028FD99AB|nr:DUF4956 domain-containing protein [Actinomyces sp. MRS3W]MDU0348509.1 DUF4956 domain-containing protein [Actinomyces sp. MRS3W]
MTPSTLLYIATDLVALVLLVGVLYTRRHARKDLVAAYAAVNVGVLAVTLLLSTASVGAGLGLGLFGVLSIIRLRSTELAQHEVAYFFAALALGLLGGITAAPIALTALLMALVVASLWISDHPGLMRRSRHQIIMLDRAITDEDTLIAHLEQLLDAQVRSVQVQRLDLVDDTTLVDVRFRLPRSGTSQTTTASGRAAAPAAPATTAAPLAYAAASPNPAADAASSNPAPAPPPSSAAQTRAARRYAASDAANATAGTADSRHYDLPPMVQPAGR